MLPLAALNDERSAAVAGAGARRGGDVADIYRLAPLQEGLFFHHRLGAGRSGRTCTCGRCCGSTPGLGSTGSWRRWQQVIDRHEVLRTSIAWEGLPHPVQVVHRHAACRSPRSP